MVCLGDVDEDTVDGASQQKQAQRLDYGERMGCSCQKYEEKINSIIVRTDKGNKWLFVY
jgi:hypothetical protein